MLLVSEILTVVVTVIFLWSVSGLILEAMHELFYNAFGNHFF